MKIKYCHSQKKNKRMFTKKEPKELDILFKQLKSIKSLYVEIKRRERKLEKTWVANRGEGKRGDKNNTHTQNNKKKYIKFLPVFFSNSIFESNVSQ